MVYKCIFLVGIGGAKLNLIGDNSSKFLVESERFLSKDETSVYPCTQEKVVQESVSLAKLTQEKVVKELEGLLRKPKGDRLGKMMIM